MVTFLAKNNLSAELEPLWYKKLSEKVMDTKRTISLSKIIT